MTVQNKILEKYHICADKHCDKTIMVKKVYIDMLYIPLCSKCIKKHRNRIIKYKKTVKYLSDKELIEAYFHTIHLI